MGTRSRYCVPPLDVAQTNERYVLRLRTCCRSLQQFKRENRRSLVPLCFGGRSARVSPEVAAEPARTHPRSYPPFAIASKNFFIRGTSSTSRFPLTPSTMSCRAAAQIRCPSPLSAIYTLRNSRLTKNCDARDDDILPAKTLGIEPKAISVSAPARRRGAKPDEVDQEPLVVRPVAHAPAFVPRPSLHRGQTGIADLADLLAERLLGIEHF